MEQISRIEENWKIREDVQIPPFRNFDEFLLGKARFEAFFDKIFCKILYDKDGKFIIWKDNRITKRKLKNEVNKNKKR